MLLFLGFRLLGLAFGLARARLRRLLDLRQRLLDEFVGVVDVLVQLLLNRLGVALLLFLPLLELLALPFHLLPQLLVPLLELCHLLLHCQNVLVLV